MFNNYEKMYVKYLKLAKRYSKDRNINRISKKQHQLILKLLLKDFDGADDETICAGILEYLEMMFGSNQELCTYLSTLKKHTFNRKLLRRLDLLLQATLLKATEQSKSANDDLYFTKFRISKGFTKEQAELVKRKYANYAEYAINKAIDPNFKPKHHKSLKTGEFEKVDRPGLVDMFMPDNFYKLSNKQKGLLFQSVVNEYCRSNGVSPCAVAFGNLPISNKSVCYGEYIPSQSTIVLNKAVLDTLDEASLLKNPYLPLQLLSTLIHEAQHNVQFSNDNNYNCSPKDLVVSSSIKHPQNTLCYADYLAELDEVDARNSSLEYIRNIANLTGNEKLMQFYNTKKIAELKNKKSEIDESLKQYFPDVYNEQILLKNKTMNSDLIEFNKILKGIYNNEFYK